MARISSLISLATVACAFGPIISGCSASVFSGAINSGNLIDTVGVNVVPTHHLGKDYSVEDVYVNGQWSGDAGRGGGGGYVCCVMLPEVWRPGLVAKIKWRVLDWRQENTDETKVGVLKSIVEDGNYAATAPVEYYAEPGDLYVHFFPQGKVRVVASLYSPSGREHPISKKPWEQNSATNGLTSKQGGAAENMKRHSK